MRNETQRKFWKSGLFGWVVWGSLLAVYGVLLMKFLWWLIEL